MAEIFDFQKASEKKRQEQEKEKSAESATADDRVRSELIRRLSDLEKKNDFAKILLVGELKDQIEKITSATRQCSPPALAQANKQIQSYSDEELADWIKNSNQKDWLTKPAFFRAILDKFIKE
jgi:hypothetical protein